MDRALPVLCSAQHLHPSQQREAEREMDLRGWEHFEDLRLQCCHEGDRLITFLKSSGAPVDTGGLVNLKVIRL